MTEQEQEDLQLYGKEVFERNRFADNNQCGNCGHFGYWLSDCAFPDDQGTIMGCPLCNTKLHFWDQCQRKKMLTTKQQLQLLLVRRRRKPMIRTTTSLRELLAEALQGFTMMLVKKRRDQPGLKYGPDELAEFPIDPETTGNVEDVMNTSVAGNEHHVRRAEL
ncbi:hypothetical protein COL516b_007715 [Colletotrichum fioriniae]|nr:uncharacterized protein COL516b_007715 [Colletotrichum fioriniae]KAJ0301738.1 hypothetical protein COL516b_007715 [Colletotrichum fioriniae]